MNKQIVNNVVYVLVAVLLITLIVVLVMMFVNKDDEKDFKDDLKELRKDLKIFKDIKDSDIDDLYTLNTELVQAVYRNHNTRDIFQNLLKNIESKNCNIENIMSALKKKVDDGKIKNFDHILHDVFNGVKGCKDISGSKSEVRISMMLLLVVLMRMIIIEIPSMDFINKIINEIISKIPGLGPGPVIPPLSSGLHQ